MGNISFYAPPAGKWLIELREKSAGMKSLIETFIYFVHVLPWNISHTKRELVEILFEFIFAHSCTFLHLVYIVIV